VATDLGPDFRLLVTGSRNWDHRRSIEQVLRYYLRQAVHNGHRLVVTQGEAVAGADKTTNDWAEHAMRVGWAVLNDPHPARWSVCSHERCRPGHQIRRPSGTYYCPYAGFVRNQVMVDTRPHVCVAFWRAGSSGTRDCRTRALDAGIPVLTVHWGDRDGVDAAWLAEQAPLAHLVGGTDAIG